MIFQTLYSSSSQLLLLMSIKRSSFQYLNLSNNKISCGSSRIIKKPLSYSSCSSSLVVPTTTTNNKMNQIPLIVQTVPNSRFLNLGGQKRHYNCSIIYWTNKKIDSKQKDQFIHDHLNSSQDFNENHNELIPHEQEIVKEPPRERYGVLKAIIIIVAGIYFGAYVAMIGAKLLEDLDIFVQERDDDDDKD